MKPLEWFNKNRNPEHGQALIYTVMVMLVLVCFIALVINAGRTINWKIKMQNSADASAVSGAIWQARALNMIAALNDGISLCTAAIAGMVTAIGLSKGLLLPALLPHIIKTYRAAQKMAKVQDIIKKMNPILVEGEVLRIARLNGIKGAIAVAPDVVPWPELHIHRLGAPESFNPGTQWEIGNDIIDYYPGDSGINTIIPTPYVRDSDFDEKQYVFCIAFDEPKEIVSPGKRIFGIENPVLVHMPEITLAGNRIGGDIGYIAIAQARPINPKEPAPFLLVPQWDVELTPVTAPGDIPIPGLKEIARLLQENLICH